MVEEVPHPLNHIIHIIYIQKISFFNKKYTPPPSPPFRKHKILFIINTHINQTNKPTHFERKAKSHPLNPLYIWLHKNDKKNYEC